METLFYHPLTPFQWSLVIGFGLCFIIEVSYLIFYIRNLNKTKPQPTQNDIAPVSIIICSKNQAHYLEKNLPAFLNQDFTEYEVIVVDNGSVDDTEDVLIRLKNQFKHLRSTKIPIDEKFKHNKKLAITIGVKAAKYNQILHINPNSYPKTKEWLRNTANLAHDKLYNSYSNFEFQKGFLYNFFRYDILKQSVKISSFTTSQKLYAGNSFNMSFQKSKFLENKGYAGNAHFEAGYDHILCNDLAKKSDYIYSTNPSTKITIDSKNCKKVWKSLNKHYYKSRYNIPFKRKFLIDLEPITQFFFILFLALCLMYTKLHLTLLTICIIKIAVKGYCFKISASHLREENLFLSSYVYVFIRPIFKLLFYIQNNIYSLRS